MHPVVNNIMAVEVQYFLPYVTSELHPTRQAIIKDLKQTVEK